MGGRCAGSEDGAGFASLKLIRKTRASLQKSNGMEKCMHRDSAFTMWTALSAFHSQKNLNAGFGPSQFTKIFPVIGFAFRSASVKNFGVRQVTSTQESSTASTVGGANEKKSEAGTLIMEPSALV